MFQSGIRRAVLAAVAVAVTVVATIPSRAARAARSASRLAVFALAAAAAVFAALALTGDDADAQAAGQVKSLSVGGGHVCAVTSANAVLCWGRNDQGQATAPVTGNIQNVAAGEDYTCSNQGFDYIGDCWGSYAGSSEYIEPFASNHGSDYHFDPDKIGIDHYCTYYSGWNSRTSFQGSNVYGQRLSGGCYGLVSLGGWHTCRLNSNNGSIRCVGRNDSGQINVPNGRYVSVDAGREHTCAVTDENRLRCWGADTLNQSSPPGGSDYTEVSSNAFANFNCALTEEKKVLCWGDNQYGQLNVPADIAAPPPLQFTREIEWINSRQNQPIGPFVLPPATGGSGRLSYNIAHTKSGQRKKGAPLGLVFDETTRRLSGRPFDDAGWIFLHYSVSDTSGRTEEVDIFLEINGPVPAGYPPAITTPELGILDRGLIRCGVWSKESRFGTTGTGVDRPFEAYSFNLTSPARLTIDLESAEADTYLYLYSGGGDRWQDDDGGQGTNSRLTEGLAPARYWIIVITSPDSDQTEGAYTLRIRSPDFASGNADASASCPSGRTSQGSTSSSSTEGTLDSASAGRIAARRIANGSIEFAWQVEGGDRILPRSRYLPADPPTGRWLNSSAIIVEGVDLGRINVRVNADTGRVEFAFTPAGGERILPPSRYFPSSAEAGVWLQSTLIEPGG